MGRNAYTEIAKANLKRKQAFAEKERENAALQEKVSRPVVKTGSWTRRIQDFCTLRQSVPDNQRASKSRDKREPE